MTLLLRISLVYAVIVGAFLIASVSDAFLGTKLADSLIPNWLNTTGIEIVWTVTALLSLILCRFVIEEARRDLHDADLINAVNKTGIILTAKVNVIISLLLAAIHTSFAIIGLYSLTHTPVIRPSLSILEQLLGLFFIIAAIDLGAISWLMIWLRQRLTSD